MKAEQSNVNYDFWTKFTRTFDNVGNLTAFSLSGTDYSITRDTDDEATALSGGSSATLSYNANGEQTGRSVGGVSSTLAYRL